MARSRWNIRMKRAAVAVMALTVIPALAASGEVIDADGKPVAGATVCHVPPNSAVDLLCVESDERGRFDIMDSEENTLRIAADGFFPESTPATGHHVVTLRQSPSLFVLVVDAATEEPLDESEVFVVYPSAKRMGPFPARQAGVRILRILEPGVVRVIAKAGGYEEGSPVEVTLEPGEASEVVLKLRKPDSTD